MKKQKHTSLILAASLVLAASIFMQAWWIYAGYKQRKQNLQEQVGLAVKEAVDQLNTNRDITFIARMSREESQRHEAELREEINKHLAEKEKALADFERGRSQEFKIINSSRFSVVSTDDSSMESLDSLVRKIEIQTEKHQDENGQEMLKFQIVNNNGHVQTDVEWSSSDSALVEVLQLEENGRLSDLMQKIKDENLLKLQSGKMALDSNLLSEAIKSSLKNVGIDAGFEFNITGKDTAVFRALKTKGFQESSNSISAETALLPFDLVEKDLTLEVQLNSSFGEVMSQLRVMILLSVVFSLAMIVLFSMTVKRLLSQTRLTRLKSDFINNMSHELKTPLSTISLAADSILLSQTNEKRKEFVDAIKREQKRMHEHVERVLSAAQSESGVFQLNVKRVEVNSFFRELVANWKMIVIEKSGLLTLTQSDEIAYFQIDEEQLRIAFNNLLDNAVKYAKAAPKIDIEVSVTKTSVKVLISDDGIGMNNEQLKSAFEPFYRATTGNIHDVKGFGLGLSFVKQVIEVHNGNVTLSSQMNQGTTVEIILPRA